MLTRTPGGGWHTTPLQPSPRALLLGRVHKHLPSQVKTRKARSLCRHHGAPHPAREPTLRFREAGNRPESLSVPERPVPQGSLEATAPAPCGPRPEGLSICTNWTSSTRPQLNRAPRATSTCAAAGYRASTHVPTDCCLREGPES